VTFEEGWYYEGAGIYRHVWLTKTNPLHIASDGTFIYTELDENNAIVNIDATIFNESVNDADFVVKHKLLNADNEVISQTDSYISNLQKGDQVTDNQKIKVNNPHLWSVEDPYLHKVCNYC
jgi:beta-galactosidase